MKDPIVKAAKSPHRLYAKGSTGRVKLPIVRSKRPGTLDLTNRKIYKIIPFP